MVYLRRNNERSPSDLGWLQSRHTFSFGNYHDPDHMGVSALRVINDDQVQPGTGWVSSLTTNKNFLGRTRDCCPSFRPMVAAAPCVFIRMLTYTSCGSTADKRSNTHWPQVERVMFT